MYILMFNVRFEHICTMLDSYSIDGFIQYTCYGSSPLFGKLLVTRLPKKGQQIPVLLTQPGGGGGITGATAITGVLHE